MGVDKICKLKAESNEKEWPGRDWTEKVSNEFVPSFLRVMMPGYSGNFLSGKKNFTREISTSFTLKVWSSLFPSSHAVTSLTSLPSWNDKGSLKRSFVEMCEFWAIFIRSCLPWSRVVKDRTHLHLGWKTAEKHQIWGSRLICSKNPSVSFLFKLLVRQVKSSYSCFWNVSP